VKGANKLFEHYSFVGIRSSESRLFLRW
jgi:hypothetical protein